MTALLVLLIILALFAAPMWPYSSGWGVWPTGLIVVLIIVLLIFGVPSL